MDSRVRREAHLHGEDGMRLKRWIVEFIRAFIRYSSNSPSPKAGFHTPPALSRRMNRFAAPQSSSSPICSSFEAFSSHWMTLVHLSAKSLIPPIITASTPLAHSAKVDGFSFNCSSELVELGLTLGEAELVPVLDNLLDALRSRTRQRWRLSSRTDTGSYILRWSWLF